MVQKFSFFNESNKLVNDIYQKTLKEIGDIVRKTAGVNDREQGKGNHYFNSIGNFILDMSVLGQKIEEGYFEKATLDDLKNENSKFYQEMKLDNYEESYLNPEYAVQQFGEKVGQLFSTIFFDFCSSTYHEYTLTNNRVKIQRLNQMFVGLYGAFFASGLSYADLSRVYQDFLHSKTLEIETSEIREKHDPEFNYYANIVEEANLEDNRYLFKYPVSITEHELASHEFLKNYSKEKIKLLAKTVADAYIRSFASDGKDISKKSIVTIYYRAGQEKIIREIVGCLSKRGLRSVLCKPSSTEINRQLSYDHRFDMALYMSKEFSDKKRGLFSKACESLESVLSQHSGGIYVDAFGETTFSPKIKKANLKLAKEQTSILQELRQDLSLTSLKYKPNEETSFCIVALPSPEIGERFEEIFEDTLAINTLNPEKYITIQQRVIDSLDQADYVHIKGKNSNETDLKVKIIEIESPEKETAFANCGADVNIPVGEVYTSPALKGTNGLLHISHTYLDELEYVDLKLVFKDGYVSEYTCRNFDSEEENKKYIEENLLFPHKTLPMGEFAIGTNTLAYMMAKKYDILNLLPILIVEKMGPHFAVGDTCFSHEEDHPVYNPDKKEIVARDNEKSLLRKDNPDKAYTYCHTDITLPYEDIGFISAVSKAGAKVDIIRDSRFALSGTEELNEPFDA